MIPFAIVTVALAIAATVLWQRLARMQRETYIRDFKLPPGLFDKLRKLHPTLTPKECQLVAQGLRQFFLTYLKSGKKYVAMPSQVVDDLWHELILYTRGYESFCRQAFGEFLHHTPAVALADSQQNNAGLRRCWYYACREENINPRAPSRLPLLFALDTKLSIPNGFRYAADCGTVRRQGATNDGGAAIYCGTDFASSSFDGGTDGFGDGGSFDGGDSGSSSDGGGCGGGCGGGGD
jgi:hypothetical protein